MVAGGGANNLPSLQSVELEDLLVGEQMNPMLVLQHQAGGQVIDHGAQPVADLPLGALDGLGLGDVGDGQEQPAIGGLLLAHARPPAIGTLDLRSEEHTSELHSLMLLSY